MYFRRKGNHQHIKRTPLIVITPAISRIHSKSYKAATRANYAKFHLIRPAPKAEDSPEILIICRSIRTFGPPLNPLKIEKEKKNEEGRQMVVYPIRKWPNKKKNQPS